MKKALHMILFFLLLTAAGQMVHAQERIIVQGVVTNPDDDNKAISDGLKIFVYNTVGEANQAYKLAKEAQATNGWFNPGLTIEVYPDQTGFYEARVTPTGALMFFFEGSNEVDPQVIPVKGRNIINCQMRINRVLDASKITAGDVKIVEVEDPEPEGNKLPVVGKLHLPNARMGKSNARLGTQIYVLSPNRKDTLEYKQTVVLDGSDYRETQLRRMGFDATRDPLIRISKQYPELTSETKYVEVNDTVVLESLSTRVFVEYNMWLEDYNMVYFNTSQQIYDTRRLRRPMRFLEYSLESSPLNSDDPEYQRHARRERMSASEQLDIKFLQGQAKIDPSDSTSLAAVESIHNIIRGIKSDEEATLKEYYIYGVASPEGNYAKNVSLAKERMNYIAREVNSHFGAGELSVIYHEVHDRVATWEELADLMWADSLKTEANEIRSIAARYPGSMDQQGAQMRKLPYYNTTIKDYLPKLRSVEFRYVREVFRELTPDEVVYRFYNDENYREGKNGKEFTPYEFWVLMKKLQKTNELEEICQRAIKVSKANGDAWPLPYNKLAQIYIDRQQADTSLLSPFVEFWRGRVDYSLMNTNGTRTTKNPSPVIANQVIMMLLAEQYQKAVLLAELLKDIPRYHRLRSIARCLGGYFKAGKPGSKELYDEIHDTSPRNAVVMDLAMKYWAFLPDEIEALNPEDPVSDYLKAQYVCKEAATKGDAFDFWETTVQDKAVRDLVHAFQKNESLIEIADSDLDIDEKLFTLAKQEYEKPGSVLPPESEESTIHFSDLSPEEQEALIRKGALDYEGLTDEERRLYDESLEF